MSLINPVPNSGPLSSYDVKVEKLGELREVPLSVGSNRSTGCIFPVPSVLHDNLPPTIRLSKITGRPVRKYIRKSGTSSRISSQATSVDLNDGTARAALDDRLNILVDSLQCYQTEAAVPAKGLSVLRNPGKENAVTHPQHLHHPTSTTHLKRKYTCKLPTDSRTPGDRTPIPKSEPLLIHTPSPEAVTSSRSSLNSSEYPHPFRASSTSPAGVLLGQSYLMTVHSSSI